MDEYIIEDRRDDSFVKSNFIVLKNKKQIATCVSKDEVLEVLSKI